jgi:hypothetical protein
MILAPDIKFKSFMPPGIVNIGSKTYVCPGWHVVPSSVTLKEVMEHWEQELPESENKPTHTISETVTSSKGDKSYAVTFDGTFWNCECVGFGFRKDCKHVKEIKEKYKIS